MTTVPRAVSMLACLCAVAATLVACSDDPEVVTATESDSPGRLFKGTYEATVVDRLPSTNSTPTTSTWVVQSSCTGPDGGCVAMVTATTPDSASDTGTGTGTGTERMEFVFENGSWTRIVVPTEKSCTPEGTNAPVNEPWVAVEKTEFAGNDTGGLPIAKLNGSITSIQGGSCSGITQRAITLTRKGILPPGADRPTSFPFPEAKSSPGAGFSGTYQQRTTVVSWNPPTLIARPTVQTTEVVVTPTCTRDGEHCVVVMLDKPSQPGETIAVYSDEGFDQSALLPERPCPDGSARYRPRLTSRTAFTGGADAPIQSLTNDSTLSWTGACAGTVRFESTLTRIGD